MDWTPVYDDQGNLVGWNRQNQGQAQVGQGAAQQTAPGSTGGEADSGESPGFFTETFRAVAGGVRDAAQETLETIDYLGDSIIEHTGDIVWHNGGFQYMTADEMRQSGFVDPFWGDLDSMGYELPKVEENESTLGSMGRGVSKFMVGMVGGAKALKGLGMGTKFLAGSGALTQSARAALTGAVADFTVFDAYEERFSDFLRENVGLEDPITEFLSVDEDDTVMEGKLKNVLEGLGLGIASDALFTFVKTFKKAKGVTKLQGAEEGARVMNEGLAEMAEKQPEMMRQLSLFDDLTDPNNVKPKAPEVNAADAFRRTEVVDDVAKAADDARLWQEAGITQPRLRPKSPINVDAFREAWTNNRLAKAAGDVDFTDYASGRLFNHDYMDGAPEIKEVLNLAADAIDPAALPKGTTFDAIYKGARRELSDATRTAPEALDNTIRRMAKDADRQKRVVVAGKMMIQDLSREINALAWKVENAAKAGREAVADEAKLIRYVERLGELEANLKQIITGSAQTTAAGRIRTRDVLTGQQLDVQDVMAQLRTSVDSVGGPKAVRKLARKLIEAGENGKKIQGIVDVSRKSRWGRLVDVHNEYWVNAILSGPKTHMLNILSNTVHTTLLPAEKMIGGILTGNRAAIREGSRIYAGLRSSILDSFKMAGKSFIKGDNILDPQGQIMEGSMKHYNAISKEALRIKDGLLGNVVDFLGMTARLPSRFLLASDEFFKQMNYRAMTYARVMGMADDMVQAGRLKQGDVARWVADRVEQAIETGTGRGLAADPLEYAREATWTKELAQGTIGKDIQNFMNRHPALKPIMPFVRTPTNLVHGFIQRTPILGKLNRQLAADLASGDPIRVAAAKGKQAVGAMLWTGATILALDGRITGGGPKDGKLRARLMETGWQPYSFVLGNAEDGYRYVQYSRIDPFGMFFGLAADFADISGHVDDTELGELAAMMSTAIAKNITSKTYLTGMIDAINALSQPDIYAEKWWQRQLASYVPFSSAQRQIRQQSDEAMREAWSVLDAVKNNIPGLSDNLPARRSWITGEPIMYPKGWGADMMSPVGEALAAANPIIQGEPKGNPVLDELARLQHGFSAPLKTIMNRQVELTSAQYSRLLELHGTLRLGRYTMQERLDRLISSDRYQKAAERRIDPDQYRIELVRDIISDYRDAATKQLIREDADLQGKVQEARRTNGLRLRGSLSALNPLVNQ